MLGTRETCAENDAKVFNIKEVAPRKWERRVGALLERMSPTLPTTRNRRNL